MLKLIFLKAKPDLNKSGTQYLHPNPTVNWLMSPIKAITVSLEEVRKKAIGSQRIVQQDSNLIHHLDHIASYFLLFCFAFVWWSLLAIVLVNF